MRANQLIQQVLDIFRRNAQRSIQAYDFNRDGVIDPRELNLLFQQIGLDPSSAAEMASHVLAQLDTDGDGYISLNDFQGQIQTDSSGSSLSELEQQIIEIFRNNTLQALKAYDFNRDGVIDLNELIQLFQQIGYDWESASQMAKNVFSHLDTDGNGHIDIHDFENHM